MNQLNVPAEIRAIIGEENWKYTEQPHKLLSLIEQVGKEIIGKDETKPRKKVPSGEAYDLFIRDDLRAAQRLTLNALLKGEKDDL